MADNTKFVSLPPKQLVEPLSTSSTTLYANNLDFDIDGTRALAMSDLGDYGWIVIEPRSVEKREICRVSAVSGSQLTIQRGYKPFAPYDQDTATWAKTHSVGVSFVFTNAPQLYDEMSSKDNDETVSGTWTFSTSPVVPTGGSGTQAANHNDIAAAVTGASGTATNLVHGTVKLSVAAASAPNPIAVGDNDPRVPTSGQTALLAAITADAAEINKLDGMTATQAQLNEAGAFFAATDITGAESEDLTDGGETTLHSHAEKLPAYQMIRMSKDTDPTSTSDIAQFTLAPDMLTAYHTMTRAAGSVDIDRYIVNTKSKSIMRSTTANLGSVGTDGAGITVGSTYVWVVAENSGGSDVAIRRYAKDLSGVTTISISGTAFTGGIRSVTGDDTTLYVKSKGSATQVVVYTISGTTATRGTDITLTGASADYPLLFDGTNFYQLTNTTLSKWSVSGGATTATLALELCDSGSTVSNAAEASTRALIGITNVNSSEIAIALFEWLNETTDDRGYIHLMRADKI